MSELDRYLLRFLLVRQLVKCWSKAKVVERGREG